MLNKLLEKLPIKCNLCIWCNFGHQSLEYKLVFVTLTLLQVAVEEKECPFPRYLLLCIYSEAVISKKSSRNWVTRLNRFKRIHKDSGLNQPSRRRKMGSGERQWPFNYPGKVQWGQQKPLCKVVHFFQADSIQTNLLCAEKFLCATFHSQTCSKAQKEVAVYLYRGCSVLQWFSGGAAASANLWLRVSF